VSHKRHFRRFLEAAPERIHFAAHSHHLWPDVSFDAHVQAWNDAAGLADRKWDRVFSEVIPRAQHHVARRIGVSDPSTVTFAPNTHELFVRILSCLPRERASRVLTTDSEFHSFARQAARLEEDGALEVTRVPAAPHGSFVERFAEAAAQPGWDLVYLSHTFFNSGFVVPDLSRIVERIASDTLVVVDGYHAFNALPVDLSRLQERVFYLAGGYKYAMSGEGCCFLHAPPQYGARPRDTGWFAEFGALEGAQAPGAVAYAPGGARFFGSTFDPSALYRFNAVMDWLDAEQLDPAAIHAHVVGLQELFVEELGKHPLPLRESELVVPLSEKSRGHFLTFASAAAADIHTRLVEAGIITDVRGDRLRFGFGLYHDDEDIVGGVARMSRALA
jgi:selenocysteine lyase/cysteine desulfurase